MSHMRDHNNLAAQRYLDARVENAKTASQAYSHCARDPESFVAGVQYAFDKLLGTLDRARAVDWFDYNTAVDILERAKRGEPQ